MGKIKEVKNKYYGVTDLLGTNGKEIQGKAWKAVAVSSVICNVTLGACALVDKMFTEKARAKLEKEIEEIDKHTDIDWDKRLDMKIEKRVKFSKYVNITTSLLGAAIGIVGSALMIKVFKK